MCAVVQLLLLTPCVLPLSVYTTAKSVCALMCLCRVCLCQLVGAGWLCSGVNLLLLQLCVSTVQLLLPMCKRHVCAVYERCVCRCAILLLPTYMFLCCSQYVCAVCVRVYICCCYNLESIDCATAAAHVCVPCVCRARAVCVPCVCRVRAVVYLLLLQPCVNQLCYCC